MCRSGRQDDLGENEHHKSQITNTPWTAMGAQQPPESRRTNDSSVVYISSRWSKVIGQMTASFLITEATEAYTHSYDSGDIACSDD